MEHECGQNCSCSLLTKRRVLKEESSLILSLDFKMMRSKLWTSMNI